jgi:hypothetical protein
MLIFSGRRARRQLRFVTRFGSHVERRRSQFTDLGQRPPGNGIPAREPWLKPLIGLILFGYRGAC